MYGACVLVQADDEAQATIAELKAQDKGRALFLVLDRLPKQCRKPTWSGEARVLRDRVNVQDPACESAVDFVLSNVVLVDELEDALRLRRSESDRSIRYVTLAGEWIDQNGFIHAGGKGQDVVFSHLERRDRLRAAQKLQSELDERLADTSTRLRALEAQCAEVGLESEKRRVIAAEQDHRQALQDAQRLARELEIIANRDEELKKQLDAVLVEVEAKDRDLDGLQLGVADAQTGLKEACSGALEAERELQQVLTELEEGQDVLASAKSELVGSRAAQERIEHDRERVRQRQCELAGDELRRQAEQSQLEHERKKVQDKILGLEQDLVLHRKRRKKLDMAVHADKTRLMTLRVDLDRLEARLRKVRRAADEARQRENSHRVQNATLEAKLAELKRRIAEQYNVCLEPTSMKEAIDEPAVREQLENICRKMRSMGNINLLALEQYEQEKQRLEFLTDQCEDLEKAEATLSRTIKEINIEASSRFAETFRTIEQHFRTLFKELFGRDASCSLALAVPDDLMESPIVVTAKPRGKRPINISQLSSGEKTLTAIALLFAIYLVKPSPFCFLDEVDAPLDDSNIDRFMRLIRRFATDTQFILVTHNKRTMEMADRLYGITMQEQGVSRLVGVRFEEALAMAS